MLVGRTDYLHVVYTFNKSALYMHELVGLVLKTHERCGEMCLRGTRTMH